MRFLLLPAVLVAVAWQLRTLNDPPPLPGRRHRLDLMGQPLNFGTWQVHVPLSMFYLDTRTLLQYGHSTYIGTLPI